MRIPDHLRERHAQLMASDYWRERKERAKVLANHQCQHAQDGQRCPHRCPHPVYVHHVSEAAYERMFRELDSDLKVLCYRHHIAVELVSSKSVCNGCKQARFRDMAATYAWVESQLRKLGHNLNDLAEADRLFRERKLPTLTWYFQQTNHCFVCRPPVHPAGVTVARTLIAMPGSAEDADPFEDECVEEAEEEEPLRVQVDDPPPGVLAAAGCACEYTGPGERVTKKVTRPGRRCGHQEHLDVYIDPGLKKPVVRVFCWLHRMAAHLAGTALCPLCSDELFPAVSDAEDAITSNYPDWADMAADELPSAQDIADNLDSQLCPGCQHTAESD